jgi:hypothetical protein
MDRGKRRVLIATLLVLTLSIAAGQNAFSTLVDENEYRSSIGIFENPQMWTDPLDDMSHVYLPTGGLVGVEVSGGDAHLLPGYNDGWIASSIIACPPDHHYDFVLLEADLPGDSYLEISVLNATKESSKIGFANETIPSHIKVNATELSMNNISAKDYPKIRVQVNLHADGDDRPRLLAWSLYFISYGEWRDEFVGTAKMDDPKGINVTEGSVKLNLTRKGSIGDAFDYEPYPPVMFTTYLGGNTFYAFNPNPARTGYQDRTTVTGKGTLGVTFDDIDRDGDLDLICANARLNNVDQDSQIYWGSGTGTWSPSGATDLHTVGARRSATGDFNGDGEVDIAFACQQYSLDSLVFLNQGGGSFNYQPDTKFTGQAANGLDTGDLNGDGYDDIVLAQGQSARCYFGGSSGPDTTADISLPTGPYTYRVVVRDIDLDGHLDVVFATLRNSYALVYLGGPNGPDNTADYSLSISGAYVMDCAVGDVNGDGYFDLVFVTYTQTVNIFEGSAQGWSNSQRHDVTSVQYTYAVQVTDVNKDGFGDLLVGGYRDFAVHYGGTGWPSTADITKTGLNYPPDIGVAIPKGGSIRGYVGTFDTEAITRPADKKWDMLFLEGSAPQNTTMMISVLDDSTPPREIAGYDERTECDLDLSSIHQNPIRIRVTLTSEFNNTTPILDSLLVKWMDQMTWREQFYGNAKVERFLNLGIADMKLQGSPVASGNPQLLFSSLRGDEGYDNRSHLFLDSGGLDYLSRPPTAFRTKGASAVDVADANGDGFLDVAFAVHRVGDAAYAGQSPLFYGSPVGWKDQPDHVFDTVGATDVLLEDLDGDGHVDVVFAQEEDGTKTVNSTLFWGSASGWSSTPDVEFVTSWASGVVAADLNGNGRKDLAFSCYQTASTKATDSMVFLQDAAGYCGTEPSYRLPTRGARAVAAGDIDGDARVDLVFANSFFGGFVEIDSNIYWGKSGGGFDATPAELPTLGAEDVKVADLDSDGDLDLVFANHQDNSESRNVDSFVYLNDGSGGFGTAPAARLPTVGAAAVAVADLDGSDRKDLVFACHFDGSTFEVESFVYLGGAGGWSSTPDIRLPTVGASDCMAVQLFKADSGGYMSKDIEPENPDNIGYFNAFRYTAQLDASQAGRVQLIDADTWEVLTETQLHSGTHEWDLGKSVRVKEHPRIRVVMIVEGLDRPGQFVLDDLWLNWSVRVRRPPQVLDVSLSESKVLRTTSLTMWLNATDEYSLPNELRVVVEHRLNGTTGWAGFLVGPPAFLKGTWTATVSPRVDAPVGVYDFRARVMDTESEYSEWLEMPNALEVLNNLPSAPEVNIEPGRPVTTSTLSVRMLAPAMDIESNMMTYHYRWYRNGVLVENLMRDTVAFTYTSKGENWSVEVRAFDGDDEGLPGVAFKEIQNAQPIPRDDLPDPEFEEDTVDSEWLDLSTAFEDPDGDPITWSVDPKPLHLAVEIDGATGRITLTPEKDWNGVEEVTFIASDGEFTTSQTVTVTVTPVNDAPRIATVDGMPVVSDPVVYRIKQGELLVIVLGVMDMEGDEVVLSVATTMVQVDSENRQLRFEPDNEAVGWLNFTLRVYDTVSPGTKTSLNFSVEVENENDPMEVPRISNPVNGSKYTANQTFSLIGICEDPDTIYGQILNYSWSSNISGLLGYGSSLAITLMEPGTHLITLTVKDPDYEQRATVEVIIEPRRGNGLQNGNGDDGDGDEESPPIGLVATGAIAALVIIGVLYVVVTKRRTEEFEEVEESLEKREAIERMARAVKATADTMELDLGTAEAVAKDGGVETEDFEEVAIESAGMEAKLLSMEAATTGEASADIKALWQEMEEEEPVIDEAAKEEMRLETLKRKYQNAIGRLPYGIPSEELKDMDWVELAAAMATGAKKTLPDGREVTQIESRWYYSNPKDSSTFLKEHGAKPEEKQKAPEPSMAREKLLAKLEERFIIGEISEETYKELKTKYGG